MLFGISSLKVGNNIVEFKDIENSGAIVINTPADRARDAIVRLAGILKMVDTGSQRAVYNYSGIKGEQDFPGVIELAEITAYTGYVDIFLSRRIEHQFTIKILYNISPHCTPIILALDVYLGGVLIKRADAFWSVGQKSDDEYDLVWRRLVRETFAAVSSIGVLFKFAPVIYSHAYLCRFRNAYRNYPNNDEWTKRASDDLHDAIESEYCSTSRYMLLSGLFSDEKFYEADQAITAHLCECGIVPVSIHYA